MDRLPATQSLKAFSIAARLLNITHTAKQMNLTQAAVSHQIRELETLLGVRLFERKARGLELTDAGRIYLSHATEALERLRAGAAALARSGGGRVLTVTMSPNFATKWLVPRLGAFADAHPDLDLRISAGRVHVDFAEGDIDLGIRHGTGDWPELDVVRLCPEWSIPVCSPALLSGNACIEHPSDLARYTLLHDRDRGRWRDWLRAFGVDAGLAGRGPIFSDTSLAIDAAVAGQGVALARSALAALDLAAGRLLRPLPQAIAAPYAYWIVCPQSQSARPAIVAFRDWLLQQAADDMRGAAFEFADS